MMRSATKRSLPASATLLPPYFWTTMDIWSGFFRESLGVASSEWFTVRRSAFGVHRSRFAVRGSPLPSADIQQRPPTADGRTPNAERRTPNGEPLLFKHLINPRPQARRRTAAQLITPGKKHLAESSMRLGSQPASKSKTCAAEIPTPLVLRTH